MNWWDTFNLLTAFLALAAGTGIFIYLDIKRRK